MWWHLEAGRTLDLAALHYRAFTLIHLLWLHVTTCGPETLYTTQETTENFKNGQWFPPLFLILYFWQCLPNVSKYTVYFILFFILCSHMAVLGIMPGLGDHAGCRIRVSLRVFLFSYFICFFPYFLPPFSSFLFYFVPSFLPSLLPSFLPSIHVNGPHLVMLRLFLALSSGPYEVSRLEACLAQCKTSPLLFLHLSGPWLVNFYHWKA